MAIHILITYVTAGAGHRRAAEVLTQVAHTAFPDAQIRCLDLLDATPRWFRRGYPATYYLLVRHFARLWGACFEWLDRRWVYALVQPLRRLWNLLMTRRFLRDLKREPPDVIIATHFFPADVISTCKGAGWLRSPLVVVITDLHPHRFWLSREAEAYVCGTQRSAEEAAQRGVPVERLHVLGIPIAPAFHAAFHRAELQQRFGLEPTRRTILVTSGGNTVGPFEKVVTALMELEESLPGQLQLVVVCGQDAVTAHRLSLQASRATMPVRVFGFIDTMPEVMAVSDLVVAKAGGLTVTEAMGRGLPLIVYHAIPGQERFNADYVVKHGAAVMAHGPQDVAAMVRNLLSSPHRFLAMGDAARALARPNAAMAIAKQVVKPLLQSIVHSP